MDLFWSYSNPNMHSFWLISKVKINFNKIEGVVLLKRVTQGWSYMNEFS